MKLLREEIQKNIPRIMSGYTFTKIEITYPYYTLGHLIGTHAPGAGYDGYSPLFDTINEAIDERKKALRRWKRTDQSEEPFILGVDLNANSFVLPNRQWRKFDV